MYIHYFATIEDRKNLLHKIEQLVPIKYVRMGNFLKAETKLKLLNFDSIDSIEKSENVNSKQLSTNDSYLIFLKNTDVIISEFTDHNKQERFVIHEGINPESVEYTRSGIFHNKIYVHGRFATLAGSDTAKQIFKEIKKVVKKEFILVKVFYLGENAKKAFDNGIRFASASVDSPNEYDLKY